MKLVSLSKIFDIRGGHSLDLNKLTISTAKEGVAYVSRKSGDNGISAYVKKISSIQSGKAGELTCALSGNGVLSTFIQDRDFYTSYHVAILTPKVKLTQMEKFFYCYSILENQYRFNWGRQANKTLKDIQIPAYKNIPKWVYKAKISNIIKKPLVNKKYNLDIEKWQYFKIEDLFIIQGTQSFTKFEIKDYGIGNFPYIVTSSKNNGTQGFYNKYTEDGNVLTIDSATVGSCFYQRNNFSASDHVEKLIPKFLMNTYIALFLVIIINQEKYRYGYGRKFAQIRIKDTKIKLPVLNNKPDWKFMENYIKSLDYSASLGNSDNKS